MSLLTDRFWQHQTEVARHGDEYEVYCNECEWQRRVRGHRSAYGTQKNHSVRPRNRDGLTERQAARAHG